MEKEQVQLLESSEMVLAIEEDYPEVKAISGYTKTSTALKGVVTKIKTAAKEQAKVTEDTPEKVTKELRKLARTFESLFLSSRSAASENESLLPLLKLSFSYFSKGIKTVLLQRMYSGIDLLEKVNETYSHITPEEFVDLKQGVADFEGLKNKPKLFKEQQQAKGTNVLSVLFTQLKKHRALLVKMGLNTYKDVNEEIAERYRLANHVSKVGEKHIAGSYSVVDEESGEIVANPVINETRVSVKGVRSKTRKLKGDNEGQIVFEKHGLGSYELVVVAEGYTTKTTTARFKKNEANAFEIKLQIINN